MKAAIIAIAKNEELYINEWIDYHLNIGFDNIIVCDNDDELILPSVVKDDRVIIEDYTKVEYVQPIAYKEMWEKYKNNYDWILFIDIDEFLFLEAHGNVKNFLSLFPEDVDIIRLNWMHFTDSDLLDVKDNDFSVVKRFRTPIHTDLDFYVKSFMNTKNDFGIRFGIGAHGPYNCNAKAVDALCHPCSNCNRRVKNIIYEMAWINHHRTKTIGEYIRQKLFRGDCNGCHKRYTDWQNYFFKTNEKTEEKIAYANELIKNITTIKN